MPNGSRELAGSQWSRRERQIMEAIYSIGEATAAQVLAALPDPPGYSAIRALLRILEEKGHLHHRSSGGKYIYAPTRPRDRAGRWAMRRVLKTFFDNSASKAMAALIDLSDADLSKAELDEISKMIERAQREKRR